MQGIQTRATPCNRPVKKRAKKKGAGSGGKTIQEIVLEFLANHISPCLQPSLERMKMKIQQQAIENRVEETSSRKNVSLCMSFDTCYWTSHVNHFPYGINHLDHFSIPVDFLPSS